MLLASLDMIVLDLTGPGGQWREFGLGTCDLSCQILSAAKHQSLDQPENYFNKVTNTLTILLSHYARNLGNTLQMKNGAPGLWELNDLSRSNQE